jgi:dimeric dUTPase (all-alpha-NTP-PPase superfamily)
MEKMKIIDETNLMNFELLAKVLAAVEKWLGELVELSILSCPA